MRNLSAAYLLALLAFVSACTSSPDPSPNVVDPAAITIQPAVATIYPGVPITLLITGGTGSYVVASDNQGTIPIAVAGVGHELTVIANPVSADTVVNLTVRDTGTAPAKTATLTVRPGTIANAVTITPSSSACQPAGTNPPPVICSGGEALVTATISQAGIPLPARGMRFEVVSGEVRFITTPVGVTPEVLSTTLLTSSDQLGLARVRLRVLANAPDQNALIQITDPETLAYQRVVVQVRQFTGTGNPPFFAVPSSLTFTGPFIGRCAENAGTDIAIFGGLPPYTVVNANGVIAISPTNSFVGASGGTFSARTFGATCFTNAPVTITDSAGRTIIVTISNVEGTQPAPAAPISLSPATLTLGCMQTGSVAVVGGTTPFAAGANSGLVTLAVTDRTVSVTRAGPPGPGAGSTAVTLSVTDGTSVGTAVVTVPTTCP